MTDAIATFEARIDPSLAAMTRPITDATRHPDNIRKHRIDKIAQSLRTHGQRKPIVVQESTMLIVAGNGTHEAAELLGWTEIAMAVQSLTDEEALAYLYADNKASDYSTYDREKLTTGLKKLMAGPGLFDTLWEADELEDLIEAESGPTTLSVAGAGEGSTVSSKPVASKPGGEVPGVTVPVERMKEVPVTLSVKDHAEFMDNIKALRKAFGLNGVRDTILEAVRRQAAAEDGAAVSVGSGDLERAAYEGQRRLIHELYQYLLSFPPDRSFTASWLNAQLEKMVPYRPAAAAGPVQAEGQIEAFPEADAGDPPPPPVVSPLREPETEEDPSPAVAVTPGDRGGVAIESAIVDEVRPMDPEDDADDAEALAQLAAFRESQKAVMSTAKATELATEVVAASGLATEAVIANGEPTVAEDIIDPSTEL